MGVRLPPLPKFLGEVLELANRLRWKRSGLTAHARSERVLSANFVGLLGSNPSVVVTVRENRVIVCYWCVHYAETTMRVIRNTLRKCT